MEEKTIQINNGNSFVGRVTRNDHGFYVDYRFITANTETALQYARAILKLCGEAPKEELKGDNCYISVTGEPFSWSTGKVIDGMSEAPLDDSYAIEELKKNVQHAGEYHIFRRVATVGPIPQSERKVTRYE